MLPVRPIILSFFTALVGFFVLSVGVEPASAEKRVALVIGNKKYEHIRPLKNTIRDAEAMASVLKALGFTIIGDEAQTDLRQEEFRDVSENFLNQTVEADVALLFYSGHGLGDDGHNYMIPVDADFGRSLAITDLIPLNYIVRSMKGKKINLVFLDACRSNPHPNLPFGQLEEMNTKEMPRVLISYATQPGHNAKDGSETHSPYTAALLQHIEIPSLGVHELLGKVSDKVGEETRHTQIPATFYSSAGNFFFRPDLKAASAEFRAAVELDKVSVDTRELIVKYQAVMNQFGRSASSNEAQTLGKLEKLELKRIEERIEELKNIEVKRDAPPKPEITDGRAMIFVPGDEFLSGCNKGRDYCKQGQTYDEKEKDRKKDEGVDRLISTPVADFWIDKREVTVAAYERCVDEGECKGTVKKPSEKGTEKNYCTWKQRHIDPLLPINCVNWHQASEYCQWAGKRLPTEMEWEKAARGKDGREFPWGNGKNTEVLLANLADETLPNHEEWDEIDHLYKVKISEGYSDGHIGIAPVGSYPAGASPYGVLDMAGNVWEWVDDWYEENKTRSRRGGSWLSNFDRTRTFFRAWRNPDQRHENTGFRCAWPPSPQDQ